MGALCRKIIRFFKSSFLPPRDLNWGYPLFVMAVGLGMMYLCRRLVTILPFSPTSLIFASLFVHGPGTDPHRLLLRGTARVVQYCLP